MSEPTFQIAILSASLVVGLVAIVLAFRTGYRAADHQKRMDAKLSSKSSMVSAVIVERGADPDAKAEEPDR